MNIIQILPYIQIVLAILIITLVLLQQSDADLGGAFGGNDTFNNNPAKTRRGFERVLFNATIIVAALFVISAIVGLILR